MKGFPNTYTVELGVKTVNTNEVVKKEAVFEIKAHKNPRKLILIAKENQRCATYKTQRKRKDETRKFERDYVPSRGWVWTMLVTGAIMTITGLSIMIPYGKYMASSYDVEDNRKRSYFLGGLWTFLPGLTLSSLATTWAVLGSSKKETSHGEVIEEKTGLSSHKCGQQPVSDLKIALALPGSQAKTHIPPTDSSGQTEVDMATVMATSLADKIPTFLELHHQGQSQEVALNGLLRKRLAPYLSTNQVSLAPSKKPHPGLFLVFHPQNGPAVQKVVFNCKAHLSVEMQLKPTDTTMLQVFSWGGHWKTGGKKNLALGKKTKILCQKDTDMALAFLSTQAPLKTTLILHGKKHSTRGEVIKAKGDNFILDKGTNDLVVPGRTGKLYAEKRGKGAAFVVVKATKDKATVRLQEDDQSSFMFFSDYTLDP